MLAVWTQEYSTSEPLSICCNLSTGLATARPSSMVAWAWSGEAAVIIFMTKYVIKLLAVATLSSLCRHQPIARQEEKPAWWLAPAKNVPGLRFDYITFDCRFILH